MIQAKPADLLGIGIGIAIAIAIGYWKQLMAKVCGKKTMATPIATSIPIPTPILDLCLAHSKGGYNESLSGSSAT